MNSSLATRIIAALAKDFAQHYDKRVGGRLDSQGRRCLSVPAVGLP